ncbi:MAG: DMT family transporter [Gammaproteobacteria bacterium]|nr:DMT family transporter [Gammaproteobacteria bacterium]
MPTTIASPTQTASDIKKGLTFLILAQIMTAINIVLAKYLLSSISLTFMITTRFVLAALMLFPMHLLTSKKETTIKQYLSSLNRKDWFFVTIQALCGGILFNLFMFLGLKYTDANLAGIITSALPAIIAIMAWFILGVKLTRKKMLCILSACAGLVIISLGKKHVPGMPHSFLGDFLIFFALIPEGLYYVLCKIHPNRLPAFLVSALINAINALIMLVVFAFIPFNPANISPFNWIILIVSALSSGLFYAFFFLGSQRVDSIMASITTAVMPIATVIFAWIILNEDLTLIECAGMILVIFSIIVYAKR